MKKRRSGSRFSRKAGAAIVLLSAIVIACAVPLISFSQSDDPLITLSYLTDVLMPQFAKDMQAQTARQIDAALGRGASLPPSDDRDSSPDGASEDGLPVDGTYKLLELGEGECLYSGSVVEMIVRPGSEVSVISPFDGQGIADITNGVEYLDGDVPAINAYLLIPRGNDGRGIRVNNEKSYILVRGDYYIG